MSMSILRPKRTNRRWSSNNHNSRILESEPYTICLRCPVTGKPFGIGLYVQTHICRDPDRPDKVWAEHEICEVRPGFIADQLGLKKGQKLLTVGTIMTSGMTGVLLQAQFMALDTKNIEMAIQRVQSADGKISQDAIIIYAKLEIDPNPDVCGLCVLYSNTLEYIIPVHIQDSRCSPLEVRRLSMTNGSCTMVRVDEIEDLSCDDTYNINISHSNAIAIVHIEHPDTQQYLKVEDGRLVLHPLLKDDNTMTFRGRLLSGYDCATEPVQLCVFRESFKDSTSYITPINTAEVGLQNIPKVIDPNVKVLNSDDPRLFYRLAANTTSSCFMSSALKDYYLAVNNEEVVLKMVLEEDRAQDSDIHFKLRKCE